MPGDLSTTNTLLGVMAAVSVIEGLVILAIGVAGWRAYRQVMGVLHQVEERHIAPVRQRVDLILADVKDVTGRLKDETERMDDAIRNTIDRVDDTADRVRYQVRQKTSHILAFIIGVRSRIEDLLQPRDRPPASAAGRL
jgi:methyl-accepting chemotaxis protein